VNEKRRGYKDAETRRIIQRAAELDAEGVSATDPRRLREIAEEAGISAAAIDQALREHEASEAPASRKTERSPGKRLVTAIVAAIVAALIAALAFGSKPPL